MTARSFLSGLSLVLLMVISVESKVYYDYNYRVIPPVRNKEPRSQDTASSFPGASWLFPPSSHEQSYPSLEYYDSEPEFADRQDPAVAAGVSLALIGMAMSAAFTGAVVAPVLSMGMERMVDTVSHLDIRMPTFPKDIFEDDYPGYDEEYYEDEEEFETEIIDAKKKRSKKAKRNGK